MTIRERILQTISKNKPAGIPLPVLDFTNIPKEVNLVEEFSTRLQGVGGKAVLLNGIKELEQKISEDRASGAYIINCVASCGQLDHVPEQVQELESVARAYIKGKLGVAENGAIWLLESAMGNRALPFICEQLVLVLDKNDLLANMHEAYANIKIDEEGYGVFIAGPSKTADIEQSLVIGAHGPKALTVLIIM